MKSILLYAVSMLVSVGLVGCYERYTVEVSGDPAAMTLSFETRYSPVLITVQEISESWDRRRTVWKVEQVSTNSGTARRKFTYGQTPDGFVELVPEEPLQPGRLYHVDVLMPGASASGDFVLLKNDGTLRVVNTRRDGRSVDEVIRQAGND